MSFTKPVVKDACIAAAARQGVEIVRGNDGSDRCAYDLGNLRCSNSNGVTTVSTTCKYLCD